MTRRYMNTTRALCPVCRKVVDAKNFEENGRVYVEKFCIEHGYNTALVNSDYNYFMQSHKFIKPGQKQKVYSSGTDGVCPERCGLCPEHEQHICMPVLEISGSCDMDCPVCIADEGSRSNLSLAEIRRIVEDLIRCEGKIDVLNLSGGEPLMHPDYREIIEYLETVNEITRISVSTNGLRLLSVPGLLDFHQDREVIISLQLDGNRGGIYEKLRGRDVLCEKQEILEKLIRMDLDCSLIMTVGRGINDTVEDVRYVYDMFVQHENFLSLLFQPLAYTDDFNIMDRVTIPDVIRLVSQASRTNIAEEDFMPLPCCNANCFSLVHLLRIEESAYLPMKKFLNSEKYSSIIKNKAFFGTDEDSFTEIKDLVFDLWTSQEEVCDCMKEIHSKALKSIKSIIKDIQSETYDSRRTFNKASRKIKSLYIHHFMDIDTFDLTRARRCCTIYPKADGRFYPICTYNNLYRRKK